MSSTVTGRSRHSPSLTIPRESPDENNIHARLVQEPGGRKIVGGQATIFSRCRFISCSVRTVILDMGGQAPARPALKKGTIRNFRMRNFEVGLINPFISIQQNIEVDVPGSPSLLPDAAQALLHGKQLRQKLLRLQRRLNGRHPIQKNRLILNRSHRLGFQKRGYALDAICRGFWRSISTARRYLAFPVAQDWNPDQ